MTSISSWTSILKLSSNTRSSRFRTLLLISRQQILTKWDNQRCWSDSITGNPLKVQILDKKLPLEKLERKLTQTRLVKKSTTKVYCQLFFQSINSMIATLSPFYNRWTALKNRSETCHFKWQILFVSTKSTSGGRVWYLKILAAVKAWWVPTTSNYYRLKRSTNQIIP